eukprot:TRINITY_DN17326_c0_g1_i6.p1 TRINITY_DN17326_c0_g1~~TRINITY_DN17326_c0_g1_i6.p1  ORF type:complete len:393 (-),score=128.50 TRINITY_DN17326_c0_g1_i6:346-1524(-)
MLRSLVGSEMCIRDRITNDQQARLAEEQEKLEQDQAARTDEHRALDAQAKADKEALAASKKKEREDAKVQSTAELEATLEAERQTEEAWIQEEAERLQEHEAYNKADAMAEARKRASDKRKEKLQGDIKAAEKKREAAADVGADREKQRRERKEAQQAARAQAEAEAQAAREAALKDKRAKEQAKHEEEVGKSRALKEGYAEECTEAYNEAIKTADEAWGRLRKDKETQQLMDSIYDSITDQAVAEVKKHFREHGIRLVETERYGLGREGVCGLKTLSGQKLAAVIDRLHPRLEDIRKPPPDWLEVGYHEMNHYYQDAWQQPTPGATPQDTPRVRDPVLDIWQSQQIAATEMASNLPLDQRDMRMFQLSLADKLDLCPNQLKVIVEAITPRN